ncbi:unnamed protein product [Choristocarpus tenellus]
MKENEFMKLQSEVQEGSSVMGVNRLKQTQVTGMDAKPEVVLQIAPAEDVETFVGEGRELLPSVTEETGKRALTDISDATAGSEPSASELSISISSQKKRTSMIPRSKKSMIPTPRRAQDGQRRFGDTMNANTERRGMYRSPSPSAGVFIPSPAVYGSTGRAIGSAGRRCMVTVDEDRSSAVARRTRSRLSKSSRGNVLQMR